MTTATAPARRKTLADENRQIDKGERHGVPHQLNIFVLDADSHITGFGRHSRLVGPFLGTGDDAGLVTLREDLCAGLPESTDEDRRKVLNGPGRMTSGRLVHVSSVRYGGTCGGNAGSECPAIEHTYRRAGAR